MYSVITEATESTPNNKVYGEKAPKNMVASSIEAVFPRSNEINQSIVRQLSKWQPQIKPDSYPPSGSGLKIKTDRYSCRKLVPTMNNCKPVQQ